jgi:hypothetical protein
MAFAELPKAGLGFINTGQSYVDGLANKFIVKPKSVAGIGGFVFDYDGETTVQLQSEITDHYIEDNSSVQDHIAKKPIRITMRGFVGELVQKKPQGLSGALDIIQNRLSQVPAYLGKYTPTQIAKVQAAVTKTQNVVSAVNFRLSQINNLVGFFDSSATGKTAQEKAYKKLQTLWANQTVMVIVSPFTTHNNMVIENLTFVQDETTKFWSDIVVVMKRMSFVSTQTQSVNKNINRNVQGTQPKIDKGQTKGTVVAVSSLKASFPNLIPQ